MFFFLRLCIFPVLINFSLSQESEKIFDSYYNKLMAYDLPMSLNCDSNIQSMSLEHFNQNEHKRYLRNFGVIGRVNLGNGMKTVIYNKPADNQIPVLVTYDRSGAEIDSLELFVNPCIEDPELKYYNELIIKSFDDINVKLYNIKRTWNEDYSRVIASDTTIQDLTYAISEDRYFIRKNYK